MTRSSAQRSLATIDEFLGAVGGPVKTAAEKAADGSTPLSEAGSIGGETSHPVKKVDDRLEKAKEGERSSENSKDVKEDQGAPSVENAAEAKTAASVFDVAGRLAKGTTKKAEGGAVSVGGSAADDHMQIGTKVAPTGEDSANETNKAKAGKEDPGSSHPARTDNNKIDGHKWAADDPLEKLAGDVRNVGNDLLATIHTLYQQGNVQAPNTKQAAVAAPSAATKQAAPVIDSVLAQQVGWELAGLLNGTMDKTAADRMVEQTLFEVIKEASDDADLFIEYSNNFFKAAEGDDPSSEGAGSGSGSPPPGGEGGGSEADAMSAALGGGGSPGGEDPMAGMGGGMGGGEGGVDQDTIALAQLLQRLGITEEQLQQAMMGGGEGGADPGGMGAMGGMGGGAPGGAPGGGAPPGGGGAPAGAGMEVAAAANYSKLSPAEKNAEMASYLKEVIGRSRARK